MRPAIVYEHSIASYANEIDAERLMNDRLGALFLGVIDTSANVSDKVERASEELELVGGDLDYLEGIFFGGNSGLKEEIFFMFCHDRFESLVKPPLLSPLQKRAQNGPRKGIVRNPLRLE